VRGVAAPSRPAHVPLRCIASTHASGESVAIVLPRIGREPTEAGESMAIRSSLRATLLLLTALASCESAGEATAPRTAASVPAASACVAPELPPPPDVPWKSAEELCATAKRGEPWLEALPPLGPDWPARTDEYALRVQSFLRSLAYRKAPYSWLRDASWRLTGSYEGCPPNGANDGPHPAVRIYYSPQVIEWMCAARKGDEQRPDAPPMPDGAVIIKEMIDPGATRLALVPGSNLLWIAPPPGQIADAYDQSFTSWTIMIKDSKASADGWYSAYFGRTGDGNPRIYARSAFAVAPYPGQLKPVTEPPGDFWYPTYWNYSLNDVQFPNYEFGNYCVYCHASAQGQTTFASFKNLLGQEIRYPWVPESSSTVDFDDHQRLATAPARAVSKDADPRSPFPSPRSEPLPGFQQTFPELDPPYSEVWAAQLPSQTWDHVPSRIGVDGVPPQSSMFLTSDQCEGCHEAGGSGQLDLPYMVVQRGDDQIDLAPWAEWGVSPMGLAGRDPIFYAQLELERNLARQQPGLRDRAECLDNLCLHCHGAAGARQYNIDTRGQADGGKQCADFLPPPAERAAADMDGKLFTHSMVNAWRDEQPELSAYGGLAREGISCTVCHRISDVDLDPTNLPKTFTGNFRTGPPDTLFGPFPAPDTTGAAGEGASAPVRTKPMENALSITPKHGAQVQTSELCGTCHTILLPVFDEKGRRAGTSYEQTTYLEWLLSDFGEGPGWSGASSGSQQSCQDCHMPSRYGKQELITGIANVQDTRYPAVDFLLPASEIDIPLRPYRRHTLYGLNAFLNAYAQQFPLLLGVRQQDFMNPNVNAPLLEGREAVLEIARTETATLTLDALQWNADALEARVRVQNLGGHDLPSGVGFRRLFIEFVVLDAQGAPLWASGRTNEIGVILRGTSEEALSTEFWQAGPDGLPFQPHHQIIDAETQVQIYEEAVQSSAFAFTSSFIHRYWTIKDNRLRPQGWNPLHVADPARRDEYAHATAPGTGPERDWWPRPTQPEAYRNPVYPKTDSYRDTADDPDYQLRQPNGLSGGDSLLYRITLPGDLKARAKSIRITLYSQSTPPSYLKERFEQAALPGAERSAASSLYYMAGHLNTQAPAEDGKPYLAGSKLRVATPIERMVP
jgi:hypothetical protein